MNHHQQFNKRAMEQTLHILIVEDLESDAEILKRIITREGIKFVDRIVETKEDFIEALSSFSPDLILSDYSLPQFNGMKALLLRQELAPQIPFMLVTGSINEDIAVECMKAGADDYIIKQNLARLIPAIRAALLKQESNRLRREAEDAIRKERILLRTLIDNLPDTIFAKDIEGRKMLANLTDLEIIGVGSEAEIMGKTDLEIFPGEIGERGYADDLTVLKTGEPIINREEDFIDGKGKHRWLHTSKIPLFDEQGMITGLVGIGHDITERKHAEDEIRQKVEELAKSNNELTRFNRLAIGREMRMIEIKKQCNYLAGQLGIEQPYPLAFLKDNKI